MSKLSNVPQSIGCPLAFFYALLALDEVGRSQLRSHWWASSNVGRYSSNDALEKVYFSVLSLQLKELW